MSRILSDFSDSEIGFSLEKNLVEQVKYYSKSSLVKYYDTKKMIRLFTGFPVATLNLIAGANLTSETINEDIKKVKHPIKEQQDFPIVWWVGPSTTPGNIGDYLEKNGWKRLIDMTGMYFDLKNLEKNLIFPKNFSYTLVDNDEKLKLWAETQTNAYEANPANTRFIYEFERSLGAASNLPWKRYIGFIDNEPVAVSISFEGKEIAAVFNVATVPKLRRSGIGTIMTKIPLLNARFMDYEVSVLKATPMGEKLYHKMGFKECCRIGMYYLPD